MDIRTLFEEHEQDKAIEKDNLFESLSEHLIKKDLQHAYSYLLDRANSSNRQQQYQISLRLAGCAILADLDQKLDLEEVFSSLARFGAWGKTRKFPQPPSSPNDVLRFLKQFPWDGQVNISWAWDAIKQFRGERISAPSEKITAVAVYPYDTSNPGLATWLSVQVFEGLEDKLICFPNPRSMAFVKMNQEFEKSLETSQAFAWQLANANGCPPVDVRWEMKDQKHNNDPVGLATDGSIGAAFALVVAKALHTYTTSRRLENAIH